jgi:hypothetical protein
VVPVAITKEHVNAIARAQSGAAFTFAEAESLMATAFDPASREAGRAYVAERLSSQRKDA